MQGDDPTEADLATVDRQIAQARRKVGNLAGHLADLPPAAAEAVREQLVTLTRRLESLEAERETVLSRRQSWEAATARLRDVQTWCAAIAERVNGLTYEQKRLALEALGVHVRLWRPGHEPRWRVDAGIDLDRFLTRSPASS